MLTIGSMQPVNLQGRSLRIACGIVAAVMIICFCSFISVLWKANHRSKYGPLHLAADSGDADEVRRLLAGGLDVNLRSAPVGFTALHVAADQGEVEVARVLLEYGAKVDLRDSEGDTALYLTAAQSSGRAQMKSTEAGRNDVARLLLEHGADANAANHFGDTPLHGAIHSDDADLVVLLLDHGADPSKSNSEGRSPIDHAGHMPTGEPGKFLHLLESHRLKK